MTDPATAHDDPRPDAFPLRRSELAAIVAFWAFFAAITAAGRLFDPRGPGPDSPIAVAFAQVAFLEAAFWAVVTVPLFALASRFNLERGQRGLGLVVLVAAAVLAAVLSNALVGWVRESLMHDAFASVVRDGRGRAGRRGGGGRGGFDRFRVLNDMLVAFGIVAAGLARDASKRYRARKEQAARLAAETARLQAQLAEARLDALRRQLDPHFLFNTLNAVSSLVERDPRGVRRMIARLSDLLRHSIEGSAEPEISLERELGLLQRYVDIMQVRFQGRLEVAVNADARARAALVPNLVLQPLVENAIKHGVGTVPGAAHVWVDAEARGDDLVLRVRDDGPGPAGPVVGREGGVGLANTRERLAQLYGDRARFTLRAADATDTTDMSGSPPSGAVAEIVLPYRPAPDARAARSA
ncbi:MAG: sensor histidine kinase [Gemmatimonadaceae bacterium]